MEARSIGITTGRCRLRHEPRPNDLSHGGADHVRLVTDLGAIRAYQWRMGQVCTMSSYSRACPGCPAIAEHRFEDLVGAGRGACTFRVATIEDRAYVPPRLLRENTFALVRHGVFVRTRDDASGEANAVDAIGPGGLVLGAASEEEHVGGYAVGHLVLCVLPREGAAVALAAADGSVGDFVALVERARTRIERLSEIRARPTTTGRIKALVALLAETLAPNGTPLARLPATLQQRDLAKLAALRHESVCRALGTLERRGLVQRSADGLAILDHAALNAA